MFLININLNKINSKKCASQFVRKISFPMLGKNIHIYLWIKHIWMLKKKTKHVTFLPKLTFISWFLLVFYYLRNLFLIPKNDFFFFPQKVMKFIGYVFLQFIKHEKLCGMVQVFVKLLNIKLCMITWTFHELVYSRGKNNSFPCMF